MPSRLRFPDSGTSAAESAGAFLTAVVNVDAHERLSHGVTRIGVSEGNTTLQIRVRSR